MTRAIHDAETQRLMRTTSQTPPPSPKRPAPKYEQALAQINALCHTLQPGDRVPALPELMRRVGASERAVLRALDELQRSGRIIRRHGSGTFIAQPAPPPLVPPALTSHHALVAVRTPDNSFFDYCVDRLFHHTSAVKIPLVCRIVSNETDATTFLLTSAEVAASSFLLFHYGLAPLAEKIVAMGGRAVVVGAPPANVTPLAPCVYGDQEEGGYRVVRHLLGLGHKRFALQAISSNATETLRWRGYHRALEEAKQKAPLPPQEVTLFAEATALWHTDSALAAAYFQRADAPTAVVAWNDHEAAYLIVALQRAGINIPGEVSVMGYDNLPEGLLLQPPLTTVDHSVDWQLRTALDILQRPHLPSPSHTMVVMPTLIERGSTGPVPKS